MTSIAPTQQHLPRGWRVLSVLLVTTLLCGTMVISPISRPIALATTTLIAAATWDQTSSVSGSDGFTSTAGINAGTIMHVTRGALSGIGAVDIDSVANAYGEITFAATSDLFVDTLVQLDTIAPGEQQLLAIVDGNSAVVGNLSVFSNGTQAVFRLRQGTTVLGSSAPIDTGTVYRIGLQQEQGTSSDGVLAGFIISGNSPFGTAFAQSTTLTIATTAVALQAGATDSITLDGRLDVVRAATGGFADPYTGLSDSGNDITYVYDQLNRLTAVIDPTRSDGAAVYTYDASGNILSIEREDPAVTSILGISPQRAPVGSEVTISGTGFSATPASNSVSFNGVAATVMASTLTQLVVTVPTGATTGTVSVTAPGGTDASEDPFTVRAATPPSITSFTPELFRPKDTVTITGTNFDPVPARNNVRLGSVFAEVISATTTELEIEVPLAAGMNGTITVSTPEGTATAADPFQSAPPNTDLLTPVPVTVGVPLLYEFDAITRNVPFTFEAEAGQRITAEFTGSDIPVSDFDLTFYASDLTPLDYSLIGYAFVEATLPRAGTYMIYAQVGGFATGDMTLSVAEGLPDHIEEIAIDDPALSVPMPEPGQNAAFTFDGTANQQVTLSLTTSDLGFARFWVEAPDATVLPQHEFDFFYDAYPLYENYVLPTTGTYTIRVDPAAALTGSFSLLLETAPADITDTLVVNAAPDTFTLTDPGQRAVFTVTASQGQNVWLNMYDVTIAESHVAVLKPDGSQLAAISSMGTFGYNMSLSFPTDGTYTIIVDPKYTATGSLTIDYYGDPLTVTFPGTIEIDGDPEPWTFAAGERAELTFEGEEDQRIAVFFSGVDLESMIDPWDNWGLASIYLPNGFSFQTLYFDNNVMTHGPYALTLPMDGTYRLVLDPWDTTGGDVTVELFTLPPDDTGTLTINAVGDTAVITTPGQNAEFSFSGTASQELELDITDITLDTASVTVLSADRQTTINQAYVSALGGDVMLPLTLPATETYWIAIDPFSTATGEVTLTLSEPPLAERYPREAARVNADDNTPVVSVPDTLLIPILCFPKTSEARFSGWSPEQATGESFWETERSPAMCEYLPSLMADRAQTAVAGQILQLNGAPLANATVTIGARSTHTDAGGRFLLTGLTPGRDVLTIDGAPAGNASHAFGSFAAQVDIAEGVTTRLPYTIWLPELDTRAATTIPTTTETETIITTPRIPGLELHLPAGASVLDAAGQPVISVSITPVPINRTPFPLPEDVAVPIYFTIQPGSATVIPDGAWLVYPNYTEAAPGTRVDFWSYDPVDEGWHVYGQGTVTEDGQQVIPDAHVRLYAFTGAMISSVASPPVEAPPVNSDCPECSPDVDLATGLFTHTASDAGLTRIYRPGDPESRAFGIGATHALDLHLYSTSNYQKADLVLPDGARVPFVRTSLGNGWVDAAYAHEGTPGKYLAATMEYDLPTSTWEMELADGSVYVFGDMQPLLEIRDPHGNVTRIIRSDMSRDSNILAIVFPDGRWLEFEYDSENRITAMHNALGETYSYVYDANGFLWLVINPEGEITEYSYDTEGRMTAIVDATEVTVLTNTYDLNGRVATQAFPGGAEIDYDYTLDGSGQVTSTEITGAAGMVRRVTFNAAGYVLTDTRAYGGAEETTTTYTRDSTTNAILTSTDGAGRTSSFTYDSLGNVTSITQLTGTPEALTVVLTYHPGTTLLASATNVLDQTASIEYDSRGLPVLVTSWIGDEQVHTYDAEGNLQTVTDPMDRTTTYTYQYRDLASTTDFLGRTYSQFLDAAGRRLEHTDAVGRRATSTYDSVGRLLSATSPDGQTVTYSYDDVGRLLSLTDVRQHTTSWTYDDLGNVLTRTDPLNATESYTYVHADRLDSYTDANGAVTKYAYDLLNRPTVVRYGYDAGTDTAESSITFSYDAAGRVDEIIDSSAGTLVYTYDAMGRILSEASSTGTVTYTYDVLGRRTSLAIQGEPLITYTYDLDNRLESVVQGTASTEYAYTPEGLLASKTMSTGLETAYGYDSSARVESITYSQGSTLLGSLSYSYDQAGRQTRKFGSFAQTDLPDAVNSATYNAANQLLSWAGNAFTYDAAGNLTTGNGVTYTWDARNQLVSMSGTVDAAFEYDALGRRVSKTVDTFETQYLHDGIQVIQEQSDSFGTSTLIYGPGIDNLLFRMEGGNAYTFAQDAVGSTLAVIDSQGAAVTEYGYDPYGNTTQSNTLTSNHTQFAGRENDGTGLYFNRNRYYSPALGRFISSDPSGFAGQSLNLYSYANNNPCQNTDPLGLYPARTGQDPFPFNPYNCANYSFPGFVDIEEHIDYMEQINKRHWWDAWVPAESSFMNSVLTFKELVQSWGDWDYKRTYVRYCDGAPDLPRGFDRDAQDVPGVWENFGNFHFGIVAAAFGIREAIGVRGAGAYQLWEHDKKELFTNLMYHMLTPPYGDEEVDYFWVKMGYWWFNNCR